MDTEELIASRSRHCIRHQRGTKRFHEEYAPFDLIQATKTPF